MKRNILAALSALSFILASQIVEAAPKTYKKTIGTKTYQCEKSVEWHKDGTAKVKYFNCEEAK